jgi:flagellar biogenesis protein FliO
MRVRATVEAVWHLCRKALGGTLRARPVRRLRLCETLSLGDRRFLAVIEFEDQRFLVGGTAASVALLSTLSPAEQGSRAEECG